MKTVKEARLEAGLTQAKMAEIMGIPKRTIEAWEAGDRTPPAYVERLVIAELERIGEKMKKYEDMSVKEMTDAQLVEVIDSQSSYADSKELDELLARADIDPTQEPYVVNGEPQVDPDDIYEEAKKKLGL
ncbi:MAG: helix-turn-helix transcriptional regulator [Clostridiales bacterium]|nr:helix-turn-helix transcriptional regulator [Clostridiales bacterium]MDY4060163.1 helix-turn-helix transcriptional regulator [Anaerovoracaceae bacterium]